MYSQVSNMDDDEKAAYEALDSLSAFLDESPLEQRVRGLESIVLSLTATVSALTDAMSSMSDRKSPEEQEYVAPAALPYDPAVG